jgi:hypothetical protein
MTDEDYEDMKRDLAERRARRERGEEPSTWQLPPREPEPEVRAIPPTLNVSRLVDGIHEHIEQRILRTVEMIGEETARTDNQLRKEFRTGLANLDDTLRAEFKTSMGKSAADLLRLREIRESAMHDIRDEMHKMQKELIEMQRALCEARIIRPVEPKANGELRVGDYAN